MQLTIANAVQVYDATPTITEVDQFSSLAPGRTAYITIWGTGFGALGSANTQRSRPSQDHAATLATSLTCRAHRFSGNHHCRSKTGISTKLTRC